MKYIKYAEAAERHLETCIKLQDLISVKYKDKEDKGDSLKRSEQNEKHYLLSNLYYLSGYVIECIYNYAIFKHIRFPDTDEIDQLEPASWESYPEAANKKVSFRKQGGQSNPASFIIAGGGGHQLSLNSQILFFKDDAIATDIPLIDGNPISRPASILFDEWKAAIRYEIPASITLTYDNVFDFVNLSWEVYEGVRTKITQDLP